MFENHSKISETLITVASIAFLVNIFISVLSYCLWQYKSAEDCNEKVHSLATKKGLVSCPIIL